jgi:ketosteroid isomerase-like protein
MSEENVEVVRRLLTAFEHRDKDAWREFCDAEIQAVPVGDWPEGEIRGHDAVWEFFIAVDEPWEPGHWQLNEVTHGGDSVAARMQRHLRGKSSGIEVEYDYWVVFSFREGRISRAEWFDQRQKALEAARLSGSAMDEKR